MTLVSKRIRGVAAAMAALLVFSVFSAPSFADHGVPGAPHITLVIHDDGLLVFSWEPVANAEYYRLMVDEKDKGVFRQIGDNLTVTSKQYQSPMQDAFAATEPQYRVDACNKAGCTPSNVTSEAQVNLLNAPMSQDLKNAFDDLLGGDNKKDGKKPHTETK